MAPPANPQPPHPNIRPSREANILLQGDQLGLGEAGAHHRRAAVARAILDHDKPQRQRAGAQRLKAAAQQLAGIEGNDHNAD
jgi:hypothetical protein